MAEKIVAWSASDGSLHAEEQGAKDKDFEIALNDYILGQCSLSDTTGQAIADFMCLHRQALLKIFKLLNGGNPITKVSE